MTVIQDSTPLPRLNPRLNLRLMIAMACFLGLWATVQLRFPALAEKPLLEGAAARSLQTLMEGNERFYTRHPGHPHQSLQQLHDVAEAQHPFAVIFGCSDSRVPPEVVFDQGLGDMFDVRVAGHVVDDVILGSLEYAVAHLEVPLIVVLGHARCGAVTAALHHEHPHNHLSRILRELAPAVAEGGHQTGDPVENSVKAHIRRVIHRLENTPVLKQQIQAGKLAIVGAYYELDSGRVVFFQPEPVVAAKR